MSHDPTLPPHHPTPAALTDADGIAGLIDRYAGLVYATCLRICGNRSDADDASQDTFLALVAQASSIRTSIPAWLHTVATRAATRMRFRRRGVPCLPDVAPAVPASHEDWQQLLPQLDQAIDGLPSALRELIVLRFLEGKDQRTIAAETGISQATVSRRLEEAMRQLRERLHHAELTVVLLACERSRTLPPADMQAAWRRMALLHRPAPLPRLTRRGFLVTACVAAVAPLGMLLASRPDGAPRVADTAPPADALHAALLCRPITLTWRHGRFDRAIRYLAEALQPTQGERLELLPSAAQAEAIVLVDVAAEDVPLQTVLTHICDQAGWRWRHVGATILIDRPLPPGDVQARIAALERACEARDGIATAGTALVTSGDADAAVAVVQMLGDATLDALAVQRPDVAALVQRQLLAAIGALATDLRPWAATSAWHRMPAGRPWAAIAAADDGRGARALARCWARCRAHQLPLTPLLCYLVGEFGVHAAARDLQTIVTDPLAIDPALDARQPVRNRATLRMQEAAIWALGALQDPTAAPLLLATLRRDPSGPVSDACIVALTMLRAPQLVPVILDRPLPASETSQGCEYTALASLDPAALARRLGHAFCLRQELEPVDGGQRWRVMVRGEARADAARTAAVVASLAPGALLDDRGGVHGAWVAVTVPSLATAGMPAGWMDAFTTHPVVALLPQLLRVDRAGFTPSRTREALRQGCPRLGAAALPALEACRHHGTEPIVSAWCLLLQARMGDARARADLLATLPASIDTVPWTWGAEACLPALPPATVAGIAHALAPVAATGHASGTCLAWMAVGGTAPIRQVLAGWPQLPLDRQGSVIAFLAMCGDPTVAPVLTAPLAQPEQLPLLASLPHTWLDPRLGEGLAQALRSRPPDAGLPIALQLCAADADAVALERMVAWLETLPVTQLPSTARLDGLELPHPVGIDVASLHQRVALVVTQWLLRCPSAAIRQQAAAWLRTQAHHLSAVVQTALVGHLRSVMGTEGDAQVRSRMAALEQVLLEMGRSAAVADPDPLDMILAGTADVCPATDFLCAAWAAAAAAPLHPASAPSRPPSGF